MFLNDIFISSSSRMTTSKRVNASTSLTEKTTLASIHANKPLTHTSNTSIIIESVTSVVFVILLVVLGIIFWRKKRKFGISNNIFSFL